MAKNPVKKPEKVYIVETPVKDFIGVGAAGIHFAYGKAEVKEGWVLEWFKKHGYTVTEKADAPTETSKEGEETENK